MRKLTAIFLCGMFFCLPFLLAAYDKDKPAASTSLRASNPEILANWSQLQTAINNEHIFAGTSAGTQTGDHTQGSARCFFQDAERTTRIDGAGFLSTDLGSIWIDTNSAIDNQFNILTSTTGPTWTPVSVEVIATLLASNRVFAGTLGVDGNFEVGTGSEFTVSSAGAVAVASTLDVTGVMTTTAASILGDGSTLAAATEAADADLTISDKGYVDNSTINLGLAKAFCSFDLSGNLGTGSFNVTSVVRDSAGEYTITWDNDFANTNYVVLVTINTSSKIARPNTKATGTCTISTQNLAGASADTACEIVVFGTLS